MKNKTFWQSDQAVFYSYGLCLIAIAVFLGLQRIYLSDYSTVNGDFQNYNIIRRILDGQTPYSEFANYLGMGIVFINAPFVALHNVFTTSLFVTNATTALSFSLAITFLLFLVTGNQYYSYFSGAVLTFAAIVMTKYFEPVSWFLGLNLFEPSNSMRMQRAFLAFLLGFIFYLMIGKKLIKLSEIGGSNKVFAAIGLSVGLSTAWCTDFGLACVFSSFIILVTLLVLHPGNLKLKTGIRLLLYLLAVGVGFLLQAMIVTRGDLPAYLDFIRGVSAYQYWYYGINIKKYMSVVDVLGNKTYMAFVVLFLLITIHYLRKLRLGILSASDLTVYFIGLSSFIASLIYIYGSSWMAYEAFRLTTILTGAGLIWTRLSASFSDNLKSSFTRICRIGLHVSLAVSFVLIIKASAKLTAGREAPFVEELGGYTSFAEGLYRSKAYIVDEKVFSTYALALEAMTGQFQPTGTDYIIHVLGDSSRQQYLDHFRQGEYQYVTTSYNQYQPFEAWVKRANWFFYRELYKSYQPSFNTDYLVMWEPVEPDKIIAEITDDVTRVNDHSYEISLSSSNKAPIVADVMLTYKTDFVANAYRYQTFRKLVAITDESMAGENTEKWNIYFIPPSSNGYHLPIFLKNGAGNITISSLPSECTVLEITDLQVTNLLPDYHYYITE